MYMSRVCTRGTRARRCYERYKMPKGWAGWRRKRRTAKVSDQSGASSSGAGQHATGNEASGAGSGGGEQDAQDATGKEASKRFTAAQRRSLFAHLAWFSDYKPVLDVEATGEAAAMAQLEEEYTSTYTRRQMRRDTANAQRTSDAHRSRMREASTHLARAKNVLHVPFSQAMKAIFFLCALVARPVWEAERKARRVVSHIYATEVLHQQRQTPRLRLCGRALCLHAARAWLLATLLEHSALSHRSPPLALCLIWVWRRCCKR